MIEVLQGFPDQVTAYACSGHLTTADYKKILADVEDRYTRHKKLRCYTEVANDFNGLDPGALWEDAKLGLLTCSTGTASRWSPTWNG
jgi:SpoIIAA-like